MADCGVQFVSGVASSWTSSASWMTDGGKTWEPDYLRIQAERIGPARSLDPLVKSPR
jgi:hypothetical protein